MEYINPDKTTKMHKLRDIHCRDTPENEADVLPDHPILGLPDVTTPNNANNNTVTISPKLYEQMVDMSTIDIPETQEAPGDNDSALPVAALLTQSLGLQMWTMQ
jgi:hypothetical protein